MPDDDATPALVVGMIQDLGGAVESAGILPDGSGFATASLPLPKDHWLYAGRELEPPPMPLRMLHGGTRHAMEAKVRAAARYAIRASTMRGRDNDFDPDAMVQNFLVGLLGYHTPDGLVDEKWMNPDPVPPVFWPDPIPFGGLMEKLVTWVKTRRAMREPMDTVSRGHATMAVIESARALEDEAAERLLNQKETTRD